MRGSLVVAAIFVVAVACPCLRAQVSLGGAHDFPQIALNLPDDIASNEITLWYALWAQEGKTGPVTRQPNVHQYVIDGVVGGRPAQHATIYAYAPACQFRIYDFELSGTTDVNLRFECAPLPMKHVRGYILPREIPLNFFSKRTELNLSGELEANWICSDVFRRAALRSRGQIVGGSCFVPSVPLGTVGTLNPDADGNFELEVPDFTKDPAFMGHAEKPSAIDFGFLELSLKDRQVGRPLGTIEATDLKSSEPGLEIQSDYPDPVVFRRVH